MSINSFYRVDGWVKTVLGPAISGAQIFVLGQPANTVPPVTPPRSTPIPFVPSPQLTLFSDNGITPLAQPVITDSFGHYFFYVAPTLYTLLVSYGGKAQQVYVDQSTGSVGSSGFPSLALYTNGTPNFNQGLLNIIQGSGITVVNDNLGNSTISVTGGGGGAGTVTHTLGPLTLNTVILGNGAADIKAGALLSGVATQYYNGLGAFSAIPTMTGVAGGLVPTPPNDATKYLDGSGNFSTPSGGGGGLTIIDEQTGIMSGTTTLNFFIPTSGMYLVNFCFNVTSTNNAGSLVLTSLNTDQNGNSGGTQNIGSISPIVGGSMNGPYNFSLLGGSLLYLTVTFSGTITSLTYIVTLVKVS
jgi:hypothetical protein